MQPKIHRQTVMLLALLIVCALFQGCGLVEGINRRLHPIAYTDELKAAADRYGLDRCLVAAVINTESRFDPDAVSVDGAEGLMQVLPSTAEWIAFRRDTEYKPGSLFDPETNLDYGCWLLRFLLDRYDGNSRYALIAYNAGFGRLDEWLKESGTDGELNEIPYAETKNYVERVFEYKEIYTNIYEELSNDE